MASSALLQMAVEEPIPAQQHMAEGETQSRFARPRMQRGLMKARLDAQTRFLVRLR